MNQQLKKLPWPLNTPQGRLLAAGASVALVSRLKWNTSWAATAGIGIGTVLVLAAITSEKK
jgi:hypothetical protein